MPQGSQRDIVKETIKKTQESIEAIKKDLENDALVAKNNASFKKTKEETQKVEHMQIFNVAWFKFIL